MQVVKYIPDRLYGFVAEAGSSNEVFFHLGAFDPRWDARFQGLTPPPILGEYVQVTLPDTPTSGNDRAPRAIRVQRLLEPVLLSGQVEAFDPHRGYGFVKGADGVTYHLHRSEMVDGHMPFQGDPVQFYAGKRQDKQRACHV